MDMGWDKMLEKIIELTNLYIDNMPKKERKIMATQSHIAESKKSYWKYSR